MQFKFFWEKVDVDVQRKDQQCYWSSFVCMAAIDKLKFPIFKESTISCKSRHPLEDWSPIEFLKWLICGLELKRTSNLFSCRSFSEGMGRMVREWWEWEWEWWENGWDGERGAGGGVAGGASQSTRVNRPEMRCGSTAAVNTQLSVVNWQLTKVMI